MSNLAHPGGPVEGFVIRSGSDYGSLAYYKSGDQTTSAQDQSSVEESVQDQDDVKLYPNPNNGEFTLEFTSENVGVVDLTIMDVSGKVVWRNNYDKSSEIFQVNIQPETIAKGMYFIRVKDGESNNTIKFMVQ